MKFEEILGKQADDPTLMSAVAELGAPQIIPPLNEDLPKTHYTWVDKGLSFSFLDNILRTIHIRLVPVENYQAYEGPLPMDIPKQAFRRDVESMLGRPTLESDQVPETKRRPTPPWIRYEYQTFTIHFRFDSQEKVDRVTLMIPEATPR